MTTVQLSLERALEIVQQAFLPFTANIQSNREDASFSLQVLDEHGRCLASLPHVARAQSANPVHLAGVVEQLRLELSKDGHALAPWSMPFIPDIDLS